MNIFSFNLERNQNIRRACTNLFHEFKFNSLASLARFHFCESAKPSENYNQQVCSSSVVSLIFFRKTAARHRALLALDIESSYFIFTQKDFSPTIRWVFGGKLLGNISENYLSLEHAHLRHLAKFSNTLCDEQEFCFA